MSWENHGRINTFSAAWRKETHESLYLTVLNILQALQPKKMVSAEMFGSRSKLLLIIVIISGVRSCRDLYRAREGQQVVPRP